MQVFQPDNIKVDGGRMRTKASGDAYERDVLLVRDKIVSAPFGQAVLELVGKTTTQPVIIWPGVRNALPAAESHAGLKAYSPDYQGLARDGSSIRGEGGGGLDVIGFMPHGNLGGAEPDVTLLHELVHAWRQANGRWKPVSMMDLVSADAARDLDGGNKLEDSRAKFARRFENWEEFLALVVEGVYASQQGAKSVRTAQAGMFAALFMALPSPPQQPSPWNPVPLTDSQRFAELYRPAIIRIMSEELALYRLMLGARAWFNPVRDLAQLFTYKSSLPPAPDIATPPGMFSGADRFSLGDFY